RRADAITTMTDWEKGWFASEGIEDARIVTTGMGPNAVRSRDGLAFRAAHGIPPDAPLVLYIGRKERYKGYIHLLDAAELVWRRHPAAPRSHRPGCRRLLRPPARRRRRGGDPAAPRRPGTPLNDGPSRIGQARAEMGLGPRDRPRGGGVRPSARSRQR